MSFALPVKQNMLSAKIFPPLIVVFSLIVSSCSLNSASGPGTAPNTPSPAEIAEWLVEEPAIIEMKMFTEREGWAVTEAEIARTMDGGTTWFNVTPPGMDETGYSVDAFILDNDHAWLQKGDYEKFPNGGILYQTTDGGRTWTEYNVPFSRGDLNFVDSENGWMLADLGVGAGSNAVAVYRTTTGGAVWERAYTNDPDDAGAGNSLPLGGIKSDLVPLDGNTAWVTGVIYAPGEIYLYRTDDGGRSWTPARIELPAGAEGLELGIDDGQMKFVTRADGFLALRMSGDSMQTAVYVTRDAGNTWRLTPTALNGAGDSAFTSSQDAILYNGERFHVTRDAAQTWKTVSPDVLFGESFVNMEFVNPQVGWVVTMDPSNHRSLYRTQDGGLTWLPVVP